MFTRPTLLEIVNRIINDIKTRITGASTLLRRSILRVLGTVYAGAVHLLYGNIEYNKDQLFVTTADEDYLPLHGGEYNILRTAAVKATGQALATGTNGTIIPIYTELESTTGQSYLTDAAYTITGGQVLMDLTAKVAGADGNEDGSTVLSFVSPIPGIDTSATITASGIDGGTDEEEVEAYRQRILNRKRRPPHGGAEFDYTVWMKEVSGVTRAWSIPLYQGVGTIGCAFVRDGDDDIIPSDSEISTVRSYIISHTDPVTGKTVGIPVTAEAGLYMITLTELSVNMTIEIYPNTTTIQTLASAAIDELIQTYGGPGQAIYKSQVNDVIASIAGEERHKITFPTGLDYITAATNQIHVPGTYTYEVYNG